MGNLTQKGKCVPWKGQWHWQTTKVCLYIHICIYRHLYRSLLSQSSGIQAHSAGFWFHSTGIQRIPVESGGMDAFLQESVGHQKVQRFKVQGKWKCVEGKEVKSIVGMHIFREEVQIEGGQCQTKARSSNCRITPSLHLEKDIRRKNKRNIEKVSKNGK